MTRPAHAAEPFSGAKKVALEMLKFIESTDGQRELEGAMNNANEYIEYMHRESVPPPGQDWQDVAKAVNGRDILAAVREFHEKFDIERRQNPSIGSLSLRALRLDLIREEVSELDEAYRDGDLEKVADALGDLLYVVAGAFVAHGLDMYGIFEEIHRSNLSKVGGHKRPDGKWVKPPTYSPANLKRFVGIGLGDPHGAEQKEL